MGNLLWFNIRFGSWHLQYGPEDGLSFRSNSYWVEEKPSKWFAVYQVFGRSFNDE